MFRPEIPLGIGVMFGLSWRKGFLAPKQPSWFAQSLKLVTLIICDTGHEDLAGANN